jgi:hypothetical protein
MILVSHAEEAEGHDCIGDFSGRFVDHHIVNRAEIVAGGVVDVGALNRSCAAMAALERAL